MARLRCGVVGLGRGASFVKWLTEIDDCQVVACCDANPAALQRCEGLKGYTVLEEMLAQESLQILAIVTPGPQHASQSLMALEHGVNVICETPNVYSVTEAQSVMDAVRDTGLRYMLAEDYIWMGWAQRWQRLIEAGKIGEIISAEGEYTHDCRGFILRDPEGASHPLSDWGKRDDLSPTWRASDLPPLLYCSHTLGPLLHLMDDRCVAAMGMNTGAPVAPVVCPVDMESALLRTAKGRLVRLTNGFCVAHPMLFRYTLYGSHGSLRLVNTDLKAGRFQAYFDDDGGGWRELDHPWNEREDGRHWVTAMLDEFVAAVRDDRETPLSAGRSMDLVVPGVVAHESAEQGGRLLQVPTFE